MGISDSWALLGDVPDQAFSHFSLELSVFFLLIFIFLKCSLTPIYWLYEVQILSLSLCMSFHFHYVLFC